MMMMMIMIMMIIIIMMIKDIYVSISSVGSAGGIKDFFL